MCAIRSRQDWFRWIAVNTRGLSGDSGMVANSFGGPRWVEGGKIETVSFSPGLDGAIVLLSGAD